MQVKVIDRDSRKRKEKPLLGWTKVSPNFKPLIYLFKIDSASSFILSQKSIRTALVATDRLTDRGRGPPPLV